LIVTDDDLSGTFGFFRRWKTGDFKANFVKSRRRDLDELHIEDKTILWWVRQGETPRNTTAYLNLKQGVPARKAAAWRETGASFQSRSARK
jgi:hypothetical protein